MSLSKFEPLYYADRLSLVNPVGDVGIVVLWTPLEVAKRKLAEISPDLIDPDRSRVAVVANLYGDGMYAMLCNLLYNPQIRHLIAVGEDLGQPTCRELTAFLADGLVRDTMLGRRVKRIKGTARFFPDNEGFDEDRLRRTLDFSYLGKFSTPGIAEVVQRRVDGFGKSETLSADAAQRVRVALREDSGERSQLPSRVTGHQVMRGRPLDCWEELVVRTVKFGRDVKLRNGPRIELLNVKVVIGSPEEDTEKRLAKYGFDIRQFHAYQRKILNPVLPENISYTYGNRLLGYFGSEPDTLHRAISLLRDNPETRRAYISLWDTSADLSDDSQRGDSRPCLATLFFRLTDGALSLTATYRAHNLLTAWLENIYGLIAIQRHVAGRVGMLAGPITVISHSLGIDPRNHRYPLALAMAERWDRDADIDHATGRSVLRRDPNGYFEVLVDRDAGCIVAEHRVDGLVIKRYSADRAYKIEREIAADMSISLVSHALWLGRELAFAERELREGTE